MLGDIAIWTLIFIGGFFAGKKYDNLGEVWRTARDKVKGLMADKPQQP
jgi:hypothetical protein